MGMAFEIAFWLIVGGMAMFWWLPERLGEKRPITLGEGAYFYGFVYVWVFNQWPSVGTRRFLSSAGLIPRLILLAIVSVGFVYGWITAA